MFGKQIEGLAELIFYLIIASTIVLLIAAPLYKVAQELPIPEDYRRMLGKTILVISGPDPSILIRMVLALVLIIAAIYLWSRSGSSGT